MMLVVFLGSSSIKRGSHWTGSFSLVKDIGFGRAQTSAIQQFSLEVKFASGLMQRSKMWILGFPEPGGCQNFQNEWFLYGKIPSFEMDENWGYLHLWKPH